MILRFPMLCPMSEFPSTIAVAFRAGQLNRLNGGNRQFPADLWGGEAVVEWLAAFELARYVAALGTLIEDRYLII